MVGFVDKTGEAWSDEELQEAINCVNQIMVKHALVLPLFTVNAGTIRDCLMELQLLRKMIKEIRERKDT